MSDDAADLRGLRRDLDAAEAVVERIRAAVRSTHGPRCSAASAASAACSASVRDPLLAPASDGVGTKALIGARRRPLHGLGIDLVAMCVNDVITCGGRPPFFLDYIAVGRLDADRGGARRGRRRGLPRAGCACSAARRPSTPACGAGRFDLAGFCVGVPSGAS